MSRGIDPSDREREERLRELVEAAAALSPSERDAFVREHCAGDPELERAVRDELDALEDDPGFLAPLLARETTGSSASALASSRTDLLEPGTRLAQFTIREFVGSGGAGQVYLARQDAPPRNVAVKVLHRHLLPTSVLQRFERETHILATLEHPAIAKIFDAHTRVGSDPSLPQGRPWFAMEWIDGARPITSYCPAEARGRKRVLEFVGLFRTVAEALLSAHQAGVIHRDITPENVVVSSKGQVRVIDFGIALRVPAEGADASPARQSGPRLGTAPYLSPEQARGAPLDTRTDIYSLGVLLCEALTGARPKPTRGRKRLQLQEPRSHAMQDIPRDLEHVLVRMLQEDPRDRYQSASDVVQDLDRVIRSRRVSCRPFRVWLDAALLVRRHPILVSTLAASILALTASFGFAWDRALAARSERRRTERVQDYLTDLWRAPEHPTSLHAPLQLDTVLQRGAAGVATTFEHDPVALAELSAMFGHEFVLQGEYEDAETQLVRALELRERWRGAEHADTVRSKLDLALLRQSQRRFADAEDLLRQVVASYDSGTSPLEPRRLEALAWLGIVLMEQRELEEAERCLIVVRDARRESLGEEHRDFLTIEGTLARLCKASGRPDEARTLFQRTLATMREVLPRDDLDLAVHVANYGMFQAEVGRLEEAQQLLDEAVEIFFGSLGDSHPLALGAQNGLAVVLVLRERHVAAEAAFRRLLAAQASRDPTSPQTIRTRLNLGRCLQVRGNFPEATSWLQQVIADTEHEPSSMDRLHARAYLAAALVDLRRASAAESELRDVRGTAIDRFGEQGALSVLTTLALAECLRQQARSADAEALLLELSEVLARSDSDAGGRSVWECTRILARIHEDEGDAARAESLLREALEQCVAATGDESVAAARLRAALGCCMERNERLDEAERLLIPAVDTLSRECHASDPRLAEPLEALERLHRSRNRVVEANRCRERRAGLFW